jgi:hypothetical protein
MCTNCDPSCLTCSDTGINSCLSCYDGFYSDGGFCVNCDSSCLTCINSSTYCLSCPIG